MNTTEIAKIVMQQRNNLSVVVSQGIMREALGAEGYAEALKLGWITPNYETGEMQLAPSQKTLDDVRHIAEQTAPTEVPAKVESVSVLRRNEGMFSKNLEKVKVYEYAFAPAATTQSYKVGDPVAVADSGKSYDGTVSEVNKDGTYRVSFGHAKPVAQKAYKLDELRSRKAQDNPDEAKNRNQQPPVSTQPVTP
jgi:uncharacterized protein YodC (DUF2158 family)